MKILLTLCSISLCLAGFSQISVTGNSSGFQVTNNGPSELVDNSITITTAHAISSFRVVISSNYNAGDLLSYDAASNPAGLSASYSTGVLSLTGSGTAADYQALLRTVRFSTTSTNALSRTITFEAGNGDLKYYNGHFYKLVSGLFPWSAAKSNATSETFFGWQGYLATITSSGENDFIFNSVGKGWIGASDAPSEGATENNWRWTNGPESGIQFSVGSTTSSGQYSNWNAGEPNNGSSTEHYAENSYPNNGKWNDATGTGKNNYIVEFGEWPVGITVDIYHARAVTMVATQLKTTVPAVPYKLSDPAITVDPDLTVYSASNFTEGKVTISGNFKTGDALSFSGSLPGEFNGSYNSTTGVLSFITTTAVTADQWQALYRTVTFASTSNVKADRVVTFSLGNQVAFSNGHFYEYISSAGTWTNARTNAANRTYLGLTGYLTTIVSQEESDFIKQKLSADAWIGLSDDYRFINEATGVTTYSNQSTSEGKWHWVTGPEKGTQITVANAANGSSYPVAYGAAFNSWNIGEPNNWFDGSVYENVAEVYSTGGASPGRWNDNRENQLKGYVVEYGGSGGDPLLFLSANRTIVMPSLLPVTALDFRATKVNQGTNLGWSTRTEDNSSHFNVQHGRDGLYFSTLSRVQAAGNSNVKKEYTFLHRSPSSGTNYYRLQQVDRDGRFTYSQIVAVDGVSTQINLVPSPANSVITVVYPYDGNPAVATIYNVTGGKMLVANIDSHQTLINVAQFAPGIYIVEIREGAKREKLRFLKK